MEDSEILVTFGDDVCFSSHSSPENRLSRLGKPSKSGLGAVHRGQV